MLLYLGVLCGLIVQGYCSSRAFPQASRAYAVSLFQKTNPNLVWDPSNYLEDLSGLYCDCTNVGRRGFVKVEERTPEGEFINGIVDSSYGHRSDVDAVNGYIQVMLDQWAVTRDYQGQIQTAKRFGCSVRPGCSGKVTITCLFAPSEKGEIEQPPGGQNSKAFTPEQYVTAEWITGTTWDRSHFLENLSGYETDCAMIDQRYWAFTKAKTEGDKRGMIINGIYGYAPNMGSTQVALDEILKNMKIPQSTEVGCSLIPDCMAGRGDIRQMYVVAACLFSE